MDEMVRWCRRWRSRSSRRRRRRCKKDESCWCVAHVKTSGTSDCECRTFLTHWSCLSLSLALLLTAGMWGISFFLFLLSSSAHTFNCRYEGRMNGWSCVQLALESGVNGLKRPLEWRRRKKKKKNKYRRRRRRRRVRWKEGSTRTHKRLTLKGMRLTRVRDANTQRSREQNIVWPPQSRAQVQVSCTPLLFSSLLSSALLLSSPLRLAPLSSSSLSSRIRAFLHQPMGQLRPLTTWLLNGSLYFLSSLASLSLSCSSLSPRARLSLLCPVAFVVTDRKPDVGDEKLFFLLVLSFFTLFLHSLSLSLSFTHSHIHSLSLFLCIHTHTHTHSQRFLCFSHSHLVNGQVRRPKNHSWRRERGWKREREREREKRKRKKKKERATFVTKCERIRRDHNKFTRERRREKRNLKTDLSRPAN